MVVAGCEVAGVSEVNAGGALRAEGGGASSLLLLLARIVSNSAGFNVIGGSFLLGGCCVCLFLLNFGCLCCRLFAWVFIKSINGRRITQKKKKFFWKHKLTLN